MSRFSNLEWEEQPLRSAERLQSSIADDLRCLAQAELAFSRGEFESALRWYGRVLEFNPRHLGGWTGQARSLVELGQFDSAKTWADKGLDSFPNSSELLAVKAVALGRLGEVQSALAFSDASLEKKEVTAYVWLARGDVLLSQKAKHVEACFDRALQMAPGDWLVRWLGGRIRAYWQQFAAALKLVQDAATLAPDQFAIWILMGRCQFSLGLSAAATNSYQQALALHPHSQEAEMALTEVRNSGPLSQIRRWITGR